MKRPVNVGLSLAFSSVAAAVSLIASAAAAGSGAPDAQIDFSRLAGRWTVVGVAPGSGIGAYVKNDAAYVGRVLIVSADRLGWAEPDARGATFSDLCEGPVTQPLFGQAANAYRKQFGTQLAALGMTANGPHGIECMDGNWGPEAAGGSTVYLGRDGALAMSWYDGIVLKLVRSAKPG